MKRLAFLAIILLCNLTSAQNTSYKFDYYDISNGLSQNRAQAIFQANDGYIYVGSQGGLDRFDGYNFKYFSHNPSDYDICSFGWVSAIGEDSQKRPLGWNYPKNVRLLEARWFMEESQTSRNGRLG